jgi:hypothetical protein
MVSRKTICLRRRVALATADHAHHPHTAAAWQIVDWYQQGWIIEQLPRIKSGVTGAAIAKIAKSLRLSVWSSLPQWRPRQPVSISNWRKNAMVKIIMRKP